MRKRKIKTACSLVLAALCLFLVAWMWEFPSWTREGLLRRGEQAFLLENSELLFVGNRGDMTTVFARNGDSLLAVTGERTPLGWRLRRTYHREQEDGIACITESEMDNEIRYLVFGDVAEAERAELEVFLDVHLTENDVFVAHLQENYIANGKRIAPGGFAFQLQRHYSEEDTSPLGRVEESVFSTSALAQEEHVVLRLYDEHGKLSYEKEMWNIDNRRYEAWPEVEE